MEQLHQQLPSELVQRFRLAPKLYFEEWQELRIQTVLVHLSPILKVYHWLSLYSSSNDPSEILFFSEH